MAGAFCSLNDLSEEPSVPHNFLILRSCIAALAYIICYLFLACIICIYKQLSRKYLFCILHSIIKRIYQPK